MKRKPIVFICILLSFTIIFTACAPKATAIPPLSAAFSELQGTVMAKQTGQADFTRVSNGFILEQNGEIQTGDDGRVRLDLSTGTIIRIAPSSLFSLISNTPTGNSLASSFKLDIGRIWIVLTSGSANVQTPSGVASVLGSYLMVEVVEGGGIKLTCLEGSCNIKNESGDFPLVTGQSAFVLNAQTPPFVQQMSEQEVQEWLNANPEATLVVPSLTLPAPSATTESTATSEPTATDVPSTATSAPTATNIPPTATSYVPAPPPTKKKRPPVDTPTATTDPTQGYGYTISNVLFNNTSNNITVAPGAQFSVDLDYQIWSAVECPSCIDQLVIGLEGSGVYCAYNGIPGIYPGASGHDTNSLTAPTTPGTYPIGVHYDLQYSCNNALPNYGSSDTTIGTITVSAP